jgi:hypothetical protein
MADKLNNKPNERKPAGQAEKQAADASTKDGLETTRENSQTRQEVRQQKSSQGQPNRG